MKKEFKLVQIMNGKDPNSMWYPHVFIAKDGECWHVDFYREGGLVGMDVLSVIEVPMRTTAYVQAGGTAPMVTPDWEGMDGQNPIRYNLSDPQAAVAKHWGEKYAKLLARKKVVKFVFSDVDFNGGTVMTAADKAKAANLFVAFSEFHSKEHLLPLYSVLIRMFGFEGTAPWKESPDKSVTTAVDAFYDLWFHDLDTKIHFYRQIAQSNPAGEVKSSLSDLEFAIRNFVIARCLGRLSQSLDAKNEIRERRVLRKLLRKHGVPEDFKAKESEEKA